MRRLLRRSIRIGFAVVAASAAVSAAAAAQQRGGMLRGDPQQVQLDANGDPVATRQAVRRPTGFNLFGNADRARSAIKSPANIVFSAQNTGNLDPGGVTAYSNDDDPDLGACCYPTHFRYLSFFWATPPSERAKIIAEAGVNGSGLQFALGGGFNVRGWHSQNGGDNNLAVDATLGAYHAGVQSSTNRSCRDHVFNGNFGGGWPLLATSDCPETWGSLGWRGMTPVGLDDFLGAAAADPANFRFDHWRIAGPSTGSLERQFGSFQTYGLFSDYSTDDLCGTPTTRTYGKVIKPAVDACPASDPTKPGYPLGLEVRLDAFLYGIPALDQIAYYQMIIVNKSEELYGVGIDYDSLYLGLATGYFGTGQENQVYYRPELGAVISTGRCVSPTCNGGRNVAEFTPARLTTGRGAEAWSQGTQALVVLKSPIGDLRNKLFTRSGSPFATLAGIDPELLDDTITFNHAHMCGFRACAGTVWATSEANPDHMQRQFGMTATQELHVLGTRPTTDASFTAANSQVLWHTFRSYDWPALPAPGPGPNDFPQRGGFNRWVPGSRAGEGPNVQWDWDNDGIQDTLFLDSCSGKSGGQTLNTSCAGIFSDTLTNGYLNAYANVGSTINVGPFKFNAGDTTAFVFAVMGSCCGANDADSVVSMSRLHAAIDHYLGFYLGPEALPKDTIIAVDVVGGAAAQSRVTLRFTETAENSEDPFLLNASAQTASPPPGSAGDILLRLNPWLADSLRAYGLQFGTADTTGLTAIGNFDELYIFKSCDRGTTFTTTADCAPARATGGLFADLGWLPYATLTRGAGGDVQNEFTDPNVLAGLTYTYVIVGATRGASFDVISGSAVTTIGGQEVCAADCQVERIEFAPKLFNALATSGPNVTTVYVPASRPGGAAPVTVAIDAPVGFERLTVTPAVARPMAGTFAVSLFDSVIVVVRDSLDANRPTRLGTTSTVTGYAGGAAAFNGTLSAIGGVGLKGGTIRTGPDETVFTGYRIRTTTYAFNALTAVLVQGTTPLLVTNDFSPSATPETFYSSTAFPGFTIGFIPAAVKAFNTTRGEVFIGPDGNRIQPLATPYVRVNTGGSTIATGGQGGLYTLDWDGQVYGPAEPFRLDLANPQATRDAVTSSLNARAVAQTGVADAAAQAATGFTDLVPVKLPFSITNETFGRPVQVAMRQRANNNILLGSGQDTITVTVPADVWIPGDRLILIESINNTPTVTFSQFVVECPGSPGTRASCNPVALLTPGATGYIPTAPGTEQSVLYNPALTTAQQFQFTVTPQAMASELNAACTATPTGTECENIRADLKNVRVVPNPYVVFSNLQTGLTQPLLFTHVPPRGTIRIYTVSGQFVQQITWEEQDLNETGDLLWNLRTRENSIIAAGLYLYMISGQDANGRDLGSSMGKFVVIR
ncbi:MAG TPA: hypothetical protein VK922_14480 [Gemmatimonadaceae bacterium]|nr:hypothetical protein [Gemmatimonadaceae bacterium]